MKQLKPYSIRQLPTDTRLKLKYIAAKQGVTVAETLTYLVEYWLTANGIRGINYDA